eukprot:TRINITY_DN41214_c0_g1_i1.p1 TRINITY_DN41214_c0_g1~~TRINITY_DN41214_c0_g1_i1.p1  ORF type:complete len:2072 (-),score=373.64 TRINITY_DN41214_c0_g1_i1:15-6230(-)
MASDANGSSKAVCLERLQELGQYHSYLPDELVTAHAAEGASRGKQLLQLLSTEPVPPSPSELVFALRCLRTFEEQKYVTSIDLKISICLALWRLLLAAATAKEQLYGYAYRTKLAEKLRMWLRLFAEDHLAPIWQKSRPEEATPEQLEKLRAELDVRVPVRLALEEVRSSPRVDCSVSSSKRRTLVHHLVNLSAGICHFQDASAGPSLCKDLAGKLQGTESYTMLFARLLVLLTPMTYVPQVILDGQLWGWWSALQEGLVPKFDLMWFGLLARYAEIRWAGGLGNALAASGSPGSEDQCKAALMKQLPWLMNKICRTLSLPFISPASNVMEGSKGQNPPDLDRYPIPDEIDTVVMGQQSTWKDVAKFLIYMLEPAPSPDASKTPVWSLLFLLQSRMRPFLTPSNAHGDWLWHCVTLIHFLVQAYFKRISRERLLECTAADSECLTKAADEAFVGLFFPLAHDLMTARGPYEMVTSLENLSRLSQIAAMQSNLPSFDAMTEPDPFKIDLPSLVFRATDVLNDPAQSDRHVTLLHLCSSALPALLLRMPAALGGLLPITLYGIDPTDTPKTLVSMNLLIAVFSKIPCLDVNDWSGGGEKRSPEIQATAAWRWPAPSGCQLQDSSEDSGVSIVASMLPSFAVQFVEKICEYVTRIPKPAKGRGALQGMGHLETASMGLMHGAVCLIASQCDEDTYKQLVEIVAEFVRATLLPDQVKPTGLLLSAIVRACPELSLPTLIPILTKKLLAGRKSAAGQVQALHQTGLSESEATWLLSVLAAVVRTGGAHLLEYKSDLEAVIKSALLDEREAVTKLGMKLMRRVLYAITSTYVQNDYRLCGSSTWSEMMAARLGGSSSSGVLAPLEWSGAMPPWWADRQTKPKVAWHIPSEPEVAWARGLCFGVLGQVGKMLGSIPVTNIPPLNDMPEGSSWLDGLADGLSSKKKASHAAVLAIRLISSMLRGTDELWPDERSEAELRERHLPCNSANAGGTGKVIFDWLADVSMAALKALAAQEQHGSAAVAAAGSLDQLEVSRVLRKLLKCIGEILGGSRDTHPRGMRLFPSLRQVDLHAASMQLQATSMDGLHPRSRWRDLPRVWWVERVADMLECRLHERMCGHRFAGRRRAFLETLLRLSFSSSFSAVRASALDAVSAASRTHVGSRWPLVRDVILPALAQESQAALNCSSLSGDAADRENQRLNDSLSGIAMALGGGIHGLTLGVWRRGVDDSAKQGLALCEAIYASTRASGASSSSAKATAAYPAGETADNADSSRDQKCEVKSQTVAKLIGATKHWLDSREAQCWGQERTRASTPGMEDFESAESESANSSSGSSGMGALRTVAKAMDVCERTDCHWRAQVMATCVSLALLNSLGPAGVPPGCSPEELAEAKKIWLRWGQWLVKCCEPKGQPGLHSLSIHGLLLIMKRPAPLDSGDLKGLGIVESAFFDKLLKVVPLLHHMDLMNTSGDQNGQHLEPTRDSVSTMTSAGMFKLWPRIWVRKSSRGFSLRNALFWQSYVGLVVHHVAPETVVEMLRKGAEQLASQPVAEAEFHAAFTELSAGAMRALRKADAGVTTLRRQVWGQLRPWFSAELARGSQERLEDWCDAVRFIATGCQRKLLKGPTPGMSSEAAAPAPEDNSFLIPLFNFVVGGDNDLKFDALECTMAPVSFNYGSNAKEEESGSSFDAYKQLRLLMALIVEPSATEFIQADKSFCAKLIENLKPGLGHPYKQLREEVARAIFLSLRAAGLPQSTGSGLQAVAEELQNWLVAEAERLLPMLQADNSAFQRDTKDDATRPRHVVESSGLCYVLLHAALARMTTRHLSSAAPKSLGFLLAGSAHDDFELRVLASHALSLCCLAHPLGPDAAGACHWEAMPMPQVVCRIVNEQKATTEKELEKAFASALKPVIMANFFLLKLEGCQEDGLLSRFRSATEQALGHSKPEVRSAARGVLATFLALESETDLLKDIQRFKTLAGPPPSKQSVSEPSEKNHTGTAALACTLLAAADCGVPRWSGKAIQALAPYGRLGMPEGIRKEVQGAIQAFLKLQQASQKSWKECREKLTPSQLELLNDSKGKLSYFS